MAAPRSFKRRWKRAGIDTHWLALRTDIVPAVLAGAATFMVTWGSVGVRPSEVALPILASLVVVIVYFALSNTGEFLWHFAVAGYKNEIDDLQAELTAARGAPALAPAPVLPAQNAPWVIRVEPQLDIAIGFQHGGSSPDLAADTTVAVPPQEAAIREFGVSIVTLNRGKVAYRDILWRFDFARPLEVQTMDDLIVPHGQVQLQSHLLRRDVPTAIRFQLRAPVALVDAYVSVQFSAADLKPLPAFNLHIRVEEAKP